MHEPISDEHVRDLRRSLRALADAGSEQPALFPDEQLTATDLAREFDHRASVVRDALDGDLSAVQLESLQSLEDKLATMSADGAEFDADLWTDVAVRTSEHWRDVRRLAANALDAFSTSAE
jgi:hypothetical protein